jgi:hypothetical protein
MNIQKEVARRATSKRAALLAAAALSIPLLAGIPAKAASVSVYAVGLNNPRGLQFGPDGDLYVAEGGAGGTNSTQCTQVVPVIGPYTGSQTGGRISKINSSHQVTTVIDSFASDQTSPGSGGLVSGVADIAFIGNTLYALTAGGGCSHGVTDKPNGIYKVQSNNTATLVADLSAYQMAHPTAVIEPDDFEPDGTWYSMVVVGGAFYAVEPNHGEIDKITTNGAISRLIDVSAHEGHVVPTSLAYHGNFYVGNLGRFPQDIGSSKIWKVNPGAQIKTDTTGFDMVTGLLFDSRDRMYVLEMAAQNHAPAPFAGRVTRVSPNGSKEIIADGLMFPTGMTMGPDGNLYVSAFGFGAPPGAGQVLKIDLSQ